MDTCVIDKKNLVITIYLEGYHSGYEIDLERLIDSASVLDFIFQIKHKSWCTPELMMNLLECFDKACELFQNSSVQGTFCTWGMNSSGGKPVTWDKALFNNSMGKELEGTKDE